MSVEVIKCPSCNGQIQVESNNEIGFCSFCGTAIKLREIFELRHMNVGISSGDSRATALAEAEKLIEYFEQTKSLYKKSKENIEILNGDSSSMSAICFLGVIFFLFGSAISGFAFIVGLPFAIIGGIITSWSVYMINHHAKEAKQAELENEQIEMQLHRIYNEYNNCPLGIEFTNPNSLNAIYQYIRQGRAYSIKEALSLYLNDING